ncbi:MAG: ATP-binding cassette domain-containing protein [Acidobacteriota bacterium]|nr:ATP-binding cassette domain-containing protein [Acidobacteriota bacterium]
MIEVENLTKRYGLHTAIDGVNFQVKQGEILGLLGPNGAGKTTTMRILSGFFPATDGKAIVAGFNVFDQPLEVKRRVGYLPENPPLYSEMSVDAYLRFVATIKGVARENLQSRLEKTKERCGLEKDGNRLIKHLSKGYRQRVGLAQALIHEPEVLILDEPTSGLDPRQIIEVRELIKNLGGDHTVILSTHILPEVSMTCERVIIINNGKIVAVDSPQNLTAHVGGGQKVELEVEGDVAALPSLLKMIPQVGRVSVEHLQGDHHSIIVETKGTDDVRHIIAHKIIESGRDLFHLSAQNMTLEEVFVELTTEEKKDIEDIFEEEQL